MKAYQGDKPYIFVSYAHANADIIIPILERLDTAGYRMWFDEGIYSGAVWREYVASHLLSSNGVLAFISKEFCESKNCKDELNLAHEYSTIIPVYIDTMKVPNYLSAGVLLVLSGYNAVFGLDYLNDHQIELLISRICTSNEIEACRDEVQQTFILDSTENTKEYSLKNGLNFIGTDLRKATVVLNGGFISKMHAVISVSKHNCSVRNLNAANGTFLNDYKLDKDEEKTVFSGDVLRFADQKFVFRIKQ